MSTRDNFQKELGFKPDVFQVEAFDHVDNDNNVLVAAPTGAGKTVVGEYAIYRQFHGHSHTKVFYTTPIKALSNQKFHDLQNVYGENNVGLITGDSVINSDARIVVMTTEVLRNMIYASSSTLNNLALVVMDEVHYLTDKNRGSVWEEVIIHLPITANIIALSATVSNVEEFASWLAEVRGNCEIVISERRPILLNQMVSVCENKKTHLYPLYEDETQSKMVNPKLLQIMKKPLKSGFQSHNKKKPRGRKGGGRSFPNLEKSKFSRMLPKRTEIIEQLAKNDMLPCIFFIFSRNGCDEALNTLLKHGDKLTTHDEGWEVANQLYHLVEKRLSPQDLKSLNYQSFLEGCMNGYAAHHAGVVQIFKEAVEVLFEQGLIKCVFATETLALGINMPARTVVIEKLTKFNGISHNSLTPGEYTQLTGRAGRRGKDTVGYSVVVDQRDLIPSQIAMLSSNRVYPLVSSFSPNYNMAVNLLKASSFEWANQILKKSYAQFQLDLKSKDLKNRLNDYEGMINNYKEHLTADEVSKKDNQKVWKHRFNKAVAKANRVKKEIEKNDTQLYHEFSKICKVLEEFKYINSDYRITEKGMFLTSINCEHEVLFLESYLSGLFNDVQVNSLGVILSCFVSVSKNQSYKPVGFDKKLDHKLKDLVHLFGKVRKSEKHFNISSQRIFFELNFSLVLSVYEHINGAPLSKVIKTFGKNNTLGDFIRCVRSVIDLAMQLKRIGYDSYKIDFLIDKLKSGIIGILDE